MERLRSMTKKVFLIVIATVQLTFFPIASTIAADEPVTTDEPVATTTPSESPEAETSTPQPTAPASTEPVTAPAPPPPVETTTPSPQTGPTKPTGADSSKYVKNTSTGVWENDHYIWDPATNKTTAKLPTKYSYNEKTGMWETTEWRYDAPTGKYTPVVVAKSTSVPAGLALLGEEGGDSTLMKESNNTANIDATNKSTVNNRLDACATSGNASVYKNTNGGNATSGNAYTMANILNMLGSSWGSLGSNVKTFTTDINGNVTGDLYVNPNSSGPNSNQTTTGTTNNNLTVNAKNTGSIDNKVNLCAGSGQASVDSNTNAGDATSGNADAVANILNLINSSIDAGDSFVGVMNINGNLDGDILLPDYLKLGNLLTPINSGPNASIDDTQIENSQLITDFINEQTIKNNITNDASSGKADVSSNNTAGSATSGNADTNITLLNLTGRDIVGNNGLLVFVNVLGTWVGLILESPAGANTAALGSGVGSNTTRNLTNNTTAQLTAKDSNFITNDIVTTATTGDASVTKNTTAGNARTGDATASANILNMIDSKLSLSDWFGVLFINVFGSWHGSFGINTENGNIRALREVATTGTVPVQEMKVFSFVPASNNKVRLGTVPIEPTGPTGLNEPKFLLASATNPTDSYTTRPLTAVEQARRAQSRNKILNYLSFGSVLTLSFLGIEQLSNFKKKLSKQ